MKKQCPFCKSSGAKQIYASQRYKLFRCKVCNLAYINPLLTKKQIDNLYGEKYFANQKEEAAGYKNYQSLEKVLDIEAKKKLAIIKKYTNQKKLLDIGCGLGNFLKIAKQKDFQVSGNDISGYAQKCIQNTLKAPFFKGPISTKILPTKSFDVVTAWDVFEHIPEVNEAYKAVNKTLKRGGYLFLTTPNIESWDAKTFGSFWYGYKKIPEHVIFFSPQSITKILEKHGFEVTKIQSWGFVRDFQFIAEKIALYLPSIGKAVAYVFKLLGLKNKSIYLPMTDILVVAKKLK